MKKTIAGLLAAAAITGLTLTAAVPAQAMSRLYTQNCAWPGRATFDLVNDESYNRYTWTAYSPTGWKLGTHVGQSWATPWEDVTIHVTSADGYFDVVRWCR